MSDYGRLFKNVFVPAAERPREVPRMLRMPTRRFTVWSIPFRAAKAAVAVVFGVVVVTPLFVMLCWINNEWPWRIR